MGKLILASQSPRRQELLHRIGIDDFSILVPHADESFDPSLSPQEIVCHISAVKAAAAMELVEKDDIVITADTMVFLDDRRLGKPVDEADAFDMLRRLSGREHIVCTGVTVRRGDEILTQAETTVVRFRPLKDEEIRFYISTGEPMDKAGAYGIQERGSLLVEGIIGDFFNVMGLPVLRLARMLSVFGIDVTGGMR